MSPNGRWRRSAQSPLHELGGVLGRRPHPQCARDRHPVHRERSGGRSLVLRAGDSGLVHDRPRPSHLADSPSTPTAEVGLFEAAPGGRSALEASSGPRVGYRVPGTCRLTVVGTCRGCARYPWYSVCASWVCRTLDSTLVVALRLSRIRTATLSYCPCALSGCATAPTPARNPSRPAYRTRPQP
jgi:hypothetical protein